MNKALYDALTALLELGHCTQTVFWAERFPDAESTVRAWVAVHHNVAYFSTFDHGGDTRGIDVYRKSNDTTIACLRLDEIPRAETADATSDAAVLS